MKNNSNKYRVKSPLKTIKRILRYTFLEYKWETIAVFFLILISTLANVKGTLFIKDLIDLYIEPLLLSDSKDFAPLLLALTKLASFYLVGVTSTLLYNLLLVKITQGTLKRLRNELFTHMEKLPISYFDTHLHGDIMSIYTNDVDTLRQMINQSIPQAVAGSIQILATFISMISISFSLAIIALVFFTLMIVAARKVVKASSKNFIKQQQDIGKINGYIEEMIDGAKVVKVFTHEKEVIKDYQKLNEELRTSATNANEKANILMPIIGNMGYISYVLMAILGSTFAIGGIGTITVGGVASFLQLNRSFNSTLGNLSQQVNFFVMALAGSERIFKLLDEEVEIDEGHVTLVNAKYDDNGNLVPCEAETNLWAWRHIHPDGTTEYVKLAGDVVFDNVTFGYTKDKIILHNINLYARPGQKIAFVGATGAGKTTITNLINRFYDIQEGSILYDGIDVKLIKKSDLRKSLAIILQDTHLFTDTIMENVRYGKKGASDEEVYKACELSNASKFIKHLEKGYDTLLTSDAANLSQGQRQLLAISRAAIANPPVLIMDEATSSIDTHTEIQVQEGTTKLMEGRTVFAIAHRLSTIKKYDLIMVLDHGRIIERGNHEELLAKKGVYYQLYTGALELD